MEFVVVLKTKEFGDRFRVTHEFIKRLKTRYDREGIEIPFPQRPLQGWRTEAAVSERETDAPGPEVPARNADRADSASNAGGADETKPPGKG